MKSNLKNKKKCSVSSTKRDSFLGDIDTEIVGIQYHEAEARSGEKAFFNREPDNQYDINAINVKNEDFEDIGHLPRKLVSWLAPLIDSGAIRIEGEISSFESQTNHHSKQYSYPLKLGIYLCPKGKKILKKNTSPVDHLQALHETIRKTYEDIRHYRNADITQSLGQKLLPILKKDVLPETHLLLSLFPSIASIQRKDQKKKDLKAIKDHLSAIEIGEPSHYQNLTFFPLKGSNGRKSDFILLDSAIKKGVAEVREISESGSVPNVNLINKGAKPILLPEGEIIIGAKQNRVINITILIAAKISLMSLCPVLRGADGIMCRTVSNQDIMPVRVCVPVKHRALTLTAGILEVARAIRTQSGTKWMNSLVISIQTQKAPIL